jgi:hypothetical protein
VIVIAAADPVIKALVSTPAIVGAIVVLDPAVAVAFTVSPAGTADHIALTCAITDPSAIDALEPEVTFTARV